MTKKNNSKRQAILKAALELFTQNGFHATPTSKIAEKAGVATGTLFHYFKTKEDLINRLYVEIKQEIKSALATEISTERHIRKKIYKIWLNSMQWNLENPAKLHFFQQFSSSAYISEISREEAVAHLHFLREVIKEGQTQQILKDTSPDLLFDICCGINQSSAAHFLRNPELFNEETYRETAFSLLWDSIKR